MILAIGLIFARGASLGNFELLQPAVYVLAALSVVTVDAAHLARAPRAVGVTFAAPAE